MLFLFTEQSCKNCYRRKINLFCYFCWCKSKIIKNTFQCLQWQKSVGSYSCRFALSVAWQNKMTAMLKVPSYCKAWKRNSRITSSKNNHTLIFFFFQQMAFSTFCRILCRISFLVPVSWVVSWLLANSACFSWCQEVSCWPFGGLALCRISICPDLLALQSGPCLLQTQLWQSPARGPQEPI